MICTDSGVERGNSEEYRVKAEEAGEGNAAAWV